MTSENKNAEEIFQAALEIASLDRRRDYLERACAGVPDLRNKVEGLLRAHESEVAGEQPTRFAATRLPTSTPNASPTLTQRLDSDDEPVVGQFNEIHSNTRFGDYEILEEVARGGMGMVYKARQISLNRVVALKMILSGQFANHDDVQRFHREAEAAARLDHPGIVPVFEVGCHRSQHFFTMAFVEGESLANKLKAGAVSPRAAAMYIRKTAIAVQAAHHLGIVHRDLKPANILVDHKDEPRIVDFGLAKHIEAGGEMTATGLVMGTPFYMSPEQASGKTDQITAASDIFSMGAILYEAITGRPPFVGKTSTEILVQVMQDEPIAPRKLTASLPKDLEAICLKCLEKKPADRYSSAEELAEDLSRYLAGEPIRAKNDLTRRIRKWTLREPVLAAHLASILLMMIIIWLNYLILGREGRNDWEILLRNQLILGAWVIVAIVLQKTHNAIGSKNLIPMTWAAINPLFLTATLWVNQHGPRGELLSLYLALIVITGFFRRVDLVVITTATALAGFLVIVWKYSAEDPSFAWPSYQVIFGITLIVTGIMLGFQTMRMNRLSQRDVV